MNVTSLIGIIGSIILTIGAFYPEETRITSPLRSKKNRLFAIGCFLMFIYALLGYLRGGNFIFLLLEVLIMIAITFMMLDIDDRVDTLIIGGIGIVLGLWALSVYPDFMILYFILGMIGLGLGYAYRMFTLRRYLLLTIGAFFLALFSYLGASRIYFRLNIAFMLGCLIFVIKHLKRPSGTIKKAVLAPLANAQPATKKKARPAASKRPLAKKPITKKAVSEKIASKKK